MLQKRFIDRGVVVMELLKNVDFLIFLGWTLCTFFVCLMIVICVIVNCKSDEVIKKNDFLEKRKR